MSDTTKNFEDLTPPEEFHKIINDFTADILITFPEYSGIISRWWNTSTNNSEDIKQKDTLFVFRHCIKLFPERFFDILYKNSELLYKISKKRAGITCKQCRNTSFVLFILSTVK